MTFIGSGQSGTTRRGFLRTSAQGLGCGAIASWLGSAASAAGRETANLAALGVKAPHFPARARNVIFLQMCGAPSQIDLFDEKPELSKWHDQAAPESLYKGKRFAFIEGAPKLLGCPYKFRKYAGSGATVSELLPQTATIVDDLCIIKSMHTDLFNHAPAQIFMTSGSGVFGRPSMGSWVLYGLGSEAKSLPGFVVLVPGSGVSGGKALWHNGFIPAEFQGTQFRAAGEPVLFVNNPPGVDRARRRMTIDAIKELNKIRSRQLVDPHIEARTAAYELAHEMQTSVPDLANLASEPQHVLEMYGAQPGQNSFANSCLMARRLVESGVRFVQICFKGHDGTGIWDSHGEAKHSSLEHGLPYVTGQVDRPSAALVKDLKQRGLLNDTLVIWGGEFGRTCLNENRAGKAIYMGRDHWPNAFTMWMAGGGVRAGMTYGATDDFSYNVVENPVHVHDLQATILHCLGIDHERLTYRFQGRDFRLTDVHGKVVRDILA